MRPGLVAVLLILLAPVLHAKEDSSFVSPYARHAEKAREAATAGDTETLRALGNNRLPDAWVLAEELLRQGAHDAAAALAAAMQGLYFKALPAYVASRRKLSNPTGPHRLFFDAARTLRGKGPRAALEMLGPVPREAPDTVIGIRLLALRAVSHQRASDWASSAAVFEFGSEAARRIGWTATVLELKGLSAACNWRGAKLELAIKQWREQSAFAKSVENDLLSARALGYSAMALNNAGRSKEAVEIYVHVLEVLERVGDQVALGEALGNYGLALQGSGRPLDARAAYARSLKIKEKTGDRAGIALTVGSMGHLHMKLGEYVKALALFERSLAMAEAIGDKQEMATTLTNIGHAHVALGRHAKALETFDRALQLARSVNSLSLVASALQGASKVHSQTYDHDRALAVAQEALKVYRTIGAADAVRALRMQIGIIHGRQGKVEEARATFNEVLAEQRAAGESLDAAVTLGNLAGTFANQGDHETALALRRQALEELEAPGGGVYEPWLLTTIGDSLSELGRREEAEPMYTKAARAARSTRQRYWVVATLGGLAQFYLETGRPGRALSTAQRALDAVDTLVGGLGEEHGASARSGVARLFEVGALAGAREGEPADVTNFLESGRAGALLDALDRREALRWKADSLPPELRRLDLEARAVERSARRAYDAAFATGRLKAVRAAGKELDDATDRVRNVSARIQRELKQQANFFYPRAKTLDEIRDALREDQVFVLYGVTEEEALAVVVGHDTERIVTLGASDRIEEACKGLDLEGPGEDVAPALAALRKMLVEPLKLSEEIKQVLISPDGPLCYLPFSALIDRTVVMTPSGTTHVLLHGERGARGEGVLALGAPDYVGVSEGARKIHHRGRPLTSLPAAREEIERVGTKKLLGAGANEEALADALKASDRWRAVHFACHGLVDMDRPMMSSLALSSSKDNDGFLTALEILHLPIPADLAVLSACQTAKGKIVKGEGIVGLTRAFMFAGVPRVICSLWKVDDEATRALMIKFYELWNPKDGKGLGAAEALKKAQEHVRAQQNWKHPYYWAAWVLWGLP